MFKNASIFSFNGVVTGLVKTQAFVPVGDLTHESCGWSPVRGDELVVSVANQVLLHFTMEKKHLPASAVQTLLDERCAAVEPAPGKKARAALKEAIIDELLPRALATRKTTKVWLDVPNKRLVIDSVSNGVINAVLTALAPCDLNVGDAFWPSAAVLTTWLADVPADFSIDDQVTMQFDSGKTVKYASTDLHGEDVQDNVSNGAQVRTLAMTFNDRVSFVMTDDMQLRRIKPLQVLKDAAATGADAFESEFTLQCLELGALIGVLGKLA